MIKIIPKYSYFTLLAFSVLFFFRTPQYPQLKLKSLQAYFKPFRDPLNILCLPLIYGEPLLNQPVQLFTSGTGPSCPVHFLGNVCLDS